MTADAVREPPEVPCTVRVTVPLPCPPSVTFIQPVLLFVVHSQPAAVVTVTSKLPPVEGTVSEVGDTTYEHPVGAGADCVTVTVRPATVTVAVLAAPLLIPDVTDAVPGPFAPPATDSQFTPLDELQPHPCVVATETVADPPVAGKLSAIGLTS